MKKFILDNNLTVIEDKKNTDSVTVQLTVKVGSNHEKNGIRGISHFLEHMLFEGTKNRKDAKTISNEIECLGGEINAYTNNVRTCFYIKVPKKHFQKSIEIISDIIINPLFDEKDIDKEREVILKEINIFNDESRHYQWVLFESNLFSKHPARYPVYGTIKDVKSITRKDLANFHKKYYTASNCILTIVGNVSNSKKTLKKYFHGMKKGIFINNIKNMKEPPQNRPKIVKKKRKLMNSYFVLGYKTVPRAHEDSYVLDIIQAILGRGQSGRMFDEIRNKRGLAYEVGVHNDASTDFGFFATYLSAHKSNLKLIKELILKEFEKLSILTSKELKDAVGFVEGKYILDNEDTHNKADALSYWELIKDCKLEKDYLSKIRKISRKDIIRVSKKYLNQNYTIALIEQE